MDQIIWDMDMEADSLETWTLSDAANSCKKTGETLTLLELDTIPLQVVRVVEEEALNRDSDTDPLCWSSEVTGKVESLLESVEAELAFQRKVMVQTKPEVSTQKESNSILDEEVEEVDSLLVNLKPVSVVGKAETNLISESSPDEWLVDSLSESRVEKTPVVEIQYVENATDALLYDDEPDKLCGTTINEAISVVEQGLGASEEQEAYEIVHHETTPMINVQVYAVCPHKAELERGEAEREARHKVREIEDDRERNIDDENVNNIEGNNEQNIEEDIVQNIEDENEKLIDFVHEQNVEEDMEKNIENVGQPIEKNHEQKLVEGAQDLHESNSKQIVEEERNFHQGQVLSPESLTMEVVSESNNHNSILENGQVEELCNEQEDAKVVDDLHVNGIEDSSELDEEEYQIAVKENSDNDDEQVGVRMEIDSEKDVCNGEEVKLEEKHIKPVNEAKQQRVGTNMATVPTNLTACPYNSSLTSSKDNSMHVIFGVALRSAPKPVDYDAMDVAKENEKPVNLGQEEILNAAENVQKKKKKKKVDGEKKKKTKKSTSDLKASFSRERVDIDYNKKIHVRSVDTAQVQRQFNKAGDNEATKLCRLCQKQVFQMELIKAEKASWHKNCFRCKECSKQLTMDTYMSHEGVLYCKPHFKSLFQPKAVFDEEQPVRIRKPELIVRENQPVELDPDVVRSSDRPDYGLEELSNLDVKSRFSVFEKSRDEETLDRDLSRSPSMAGVKRSESILVKMAKFQAGKSLEGLSAEELNGLAHAEEEEDSSSDEEEVEGVVKSRKHKERPQSFASMGDLKHKWEKSAPTDAYARREELAEERKEELQKLRARLCAGRQVRLKEAYEQAVQSSETTPKSAEKKLDLEVEALTAKASSLKERFEKGEMEDNRKSKLVQEESDIFEAATAKQSRHLFKEMEAQNASKQESSVLRRTQSQRIPQTPDEPKKFVREVSGEVVRASDSTEQIEVPTADLASRFRFFETYKEQQEKEKAHQPRKKIVIPRQEQPEQDTTDGEIVRDPNVVRADVKIEDEVKTNTASKMLSVFRQMERGVVEEKPLGPKPLKSFTPPPDYKGESESEEEEDEDEEDEEDGSEYEDEEEEEQEGDGVHRNEDELLQLAKEKAVAKNLRAKFEKWEVQMEQRENRVNVLASEEVQVSLDTAKNLKARFESMKSEIQSLEKPRARVNRFVELQESCAENCYTCGKRVYAMEKLEAASKIFHKSCFKCSKCSCVLRLETFTQNKGKLYCTPHFKQLFITKGNYDEGFGDEQLCKRWVKEKNKDGTPGAQNHTYGRSKTPEVDEWDVLEQELLEE